MTHYLSKNPVIIKLINECFICLSGAHDHLGETLTDLFLQTLLQAIHENRALSIYSNICINSTSCDLDTRIYLYGGRLYSLHFKGELITPPEIEVLQGSQLLLPDEIHTLIKKIYEGSAVLTANRILSDNALIERNYKYGGTIYTLTCTADWTPALGLEHKAGL